MKKKQFYKYKTIAKRVYDIETIVTLGGSGLGGCTIPAPTDHIRRKHLKLRSRYNMLIKNNPHFEKMVWDEVSKSLDHEQC